jgi:2-polyprenyl-6-methoxyphenol hydroxylase-like FAD-dependent oxidoreductase
MNPKVIIVGAGPVGLLLGNILGSNRIETLILEKEVVRKPWSRAIGITPPSLEILHELGLAQSFIMKGVKGKQAVFFGTKIQLGALKIKDMSSRFHFVLSLSQASTELILENNLKKFSCITLLRGQQVIDLKLISGRCLVKSYDIQNSKEITFSSNFVCACDGEKSIIRKRLEIPFIGHYYKPTFIMGDYYDKSAFKQDAVLWFTNKGSVESFPLTNNKRRWIIQTSRFIKTPKKGLMEKVILKRTKISISEKDKISQISFGVQKFLADSYGRERVFLCGDAAHTMSPIGGQGMNTGFADAEFLAYILSSKVNNSELNLKVLATKYEYFRKIAARSATLRAELGMRVGTAKNFFISMIRSALLIILLHLPISRLLVPYFTMLNIPYNRLKQVLVKEDIIKSALMREKDKFKKNRII